MTATARARRDHVRTLIAVNDLPGDLASLLPVRARGWRPPVELPAGHIVIAATPLHPVAQAVWASPEWSALSANPSMMYDGLPRPPMCWLTDEPVRAGLWRELRAEHPRSGLWPLLVFRDASGFGWYAEDEASLARLDPVTIMSEWWRPDAVRLTQFERRILGLAKPDEFPGLAPPGSPRIDPDLLADEVAERLLAREPARIALVPAPRSADSIGLAGWSPTDNDAYTPGALSAVLRTWEERFGARVIGIGSGTLWLSVAAPPTTIEQAVRVAVEHYCFCPEVEPPALFDYEDLPRVELPEDFAAKETGQLARSVGAKPDWDSMLLQYAADIAGRPVWRFWWD